MSPSVNPRRAYDATGRREQARRNRVAILDAARTRFLELGYAGTTMGAVAADAGVSVETVYKAFGNKAGLAKTVYDVAIVGDDEPIPMTERDLVRRTHAEPDPKRKLLGYGEHIAEVSGRVCPILLLIRDAAASDSGAAELWETAQQERLIGMGYFAKHLREGGHLRAGVSEREARDVLFAYNSTELWDLLVRQRGWSLQRYGRWVGRQLVAALL